MTEEFTTMVGQQNPLPLAMEELATKILLKRPNGMTDGALRKMQCSACLRKTAFPCQDGEGTKLPGIEEWLFHL